MSKLSIIIPVYDEEKFIAQTILTVAQANSLKMQKELIIIDDGSKDRTAQVIGQTVKKVRAERKNIVIKTIIKDKNSGKGAAVKTGLLNSSGDFVIIQDADLEYNPEDYPILLEPFLKNDADVVFGSRFISNRPHRVMYFWHFVINSFLTTFSNMLTNLNLSDMETGYKAFKGPLVRKIAPKLQSRKFGFEPEITARIAKVKDVKIYEVGISYSGRTYGEGKKIGWKDGIKAIWEIIKFNLFSE